MSLLAHRNRLFALAAGLLLAGCAQTPASGDRNVLHLALQDEPHTLDPAVGYDIPSWVVEHQLFAELVTFDAHGRVVPELASGWDVRDGGRRYIFHLRPDLRFSDGSPLTAHDVVYSFDRQFWPATRGTGTAFYADVVGTDAALAGKTREVTGVRAVGRDSVAFTLNRPEPAFLSELALLFTAVIPAGRGEQPGFDRHPIGAGPFRLSAWLAGQRLVLSRNPCYYRKGLPHLDGIRFDLGIGEQLATIRFERGKLDLLGYDRPLSSADFLEFWVDPRFRTRFLTAPDNSVYYVGMNTEMAPFTDVRVREAVAMAIDRQRLLKLVNGRGVVAQGILPPEVPGFSPALRGYPYDPARARALLAAAGYPHGFSTTYWCSSNGTVVKLAQAIQQDLGQVGIRITLKPLSFASYLDGITREHTAPMFSGNWSQDYPDPSDFLPPMFESSQIHPVNSVNATFFRDSEVDALLEKADGELDPVLRLALYRQAERRIVALAPVVPLYHPVRYALVQPRVHGFVLNPVWALDAVGISLR